MSNHDDSNHDPQGSRPEPQSDDAIARLMNLAGPRDAVPADVERRVHDNVRNEWRRSVSRRAKARWAVPLALAASFIIAVALSSREPEVAPEPTARPIATIARINGQADPAADRLAVGDPVFAGDTITTAAGQGISLAMKSNLSLRLAAGTTITIESEDEVKLASGRIYADSGNTIYRHRNISIHTDAGIATDIGTQFAVSYLRGAMSVAVREGIVDVSHQSKQWTAESGDRLVLKPGSNVVFDRITKYDDYWNWAVALAPSFDIDDRPVFDFLNWVARETGKELEFANNDVRKATMHTVLRGSVAGFTPSEALKAALATTRFEYHADERRITVGE